MEVSMPIVYGTPVLTHVWLGDLSTGQFVVRYARP